MNSSDPQDGVPLQIALKLRDDSLPQLRRALVSIDGDGPFISSSLAEQLALALGCLLALRDAGGLQAAISACGAPCAGDCRPRPSDLDFSSGLLGDLLQGLAGAVFILCSLPQSSFTLQDNANDRQWIDTHEVHSATTLDDLAARMIDLTGAVMRGDLRPLLPLCCLMCNALAVLASFRMDALARGPQ